MSKGLYITIALLATLAVALVLVKGKDSQRSTIHVKGPSSQNQNKEKKFRNFDAEIVANANEFLADGRATFRFDTFGDEVFWGDALHLHEAIKGANLGGVGPGISPSMSRIA
jgi:precorrin-2 methylase